MKMLGLGEDHLPSPLMGKEEAILLAIGCFKNKLFAKYPDLFLAFNINSKVV